MSFWNGHHWEGVDTHPAAATSAKPESRVKRLGAAALEATLITALTFGLIASTAFAAKGGRTGGGGHTSGGGGSITVAPLDGTANWGDLVGFTIATSNPYPVASVTCSQGGNVVYGDSKPLYQPNIWDDPGIFTLRSIAWSGGAADCTAVLKGTSNGKTVTLGSTSFHVDA